MDGGWIEPRPEGSITGADGDSGVAEDATACRSTPALVRLRVLALGACFGQTALYRAVIKQRKEQDWRVICCR